MGQLYYEESPDESNDDKKSMDESSYREPTSVHISDDWDTIMEEFLDEVDDYQDINFPTFDDDV